jgi:hypothetical protein
VDARFLVSLLDNVCNTEAKVLPWARAYRAVVVAVGEAHRSRGDGGVWYSVDVCRSAGGVSMAGARTTGQRRYACGAGAGARIVHLVFGTINGAGSAGSASIRGARAAGLSFRLLVDSGRGSCGSSHGWSDMRSSTGYPHARIATHFSTVGHWQGSLQLSGLTNNRALPEEAMTKIVFQAPKGKVEITLEELDELLRGTSIRHVKDWDKHILHVQTADNLTLVFNGEDDLYVDVVDSGEPDYRIQLLEKGSTAMEIERRIYSIRQLYAITFLLHSGRLEKLKEFEFDYSHDLEQNFLAPDEWLQFSSTSVGSFWTALKSASATGRQAIAAVVGTFYPEGRSALLRHLRAKADSAELDVRKKELEVSSKELDLERKRIALEKFRRDEALKFMKDFQKITNPAQKEMLMRLMDQHMEVLQIDFPAGVKEKPLDPPAS